MSAFDLDAARKDLAAADAARCAFDRHMATERCSKHLSSALARIEELEQENENLAAEIALHRTA